MTPDAVLHELQGLRALARSLVHGDADADDLIQDTAVAAIAHPPEQDRPVRPWLATVLRNRWRMDRRGRSRREVREQIAVVETEAARPDTLVDRARVLEKLAAALVALDEPFRAVVMKRYLDGQSAAQIARELGIPAGTVRWRLKTGLERLRAALDESTPRWQRLLVPIAAVKGVALVKAKTSIVALVVFLVLAIVGGVVLVLTRGDKTPAKGPENAAVAMQHGSAAKPHTLGAMPGVVQGSADSPVLLDPLPGQGRAFVEDVAAPGGLIAGRIINWSTGGGVSGAELTFTSPSGATTVRSGDGGQFELSPTGPGTYSLAAIVAPGFLPYAPELEHSPVRVALASKKAVRGLTLFLFPALAYYGLVVDGAGNPVAGAKVKLAAPPAGEQVIEKIATEWTTDKQGEFVFNAPDGAVFEASRGKQRGWAWLDGDVATTKKMTITIGDAPARDAQIRGKTVDPQGAPMPEVLVTAIPENPPGSEDPRSVAFATSGPDGSFVLDNLDRKNYTLVAEIDDHAHTTKDHVAGGTEGVSLTMDVGLPLGATVRDPDDKPVPSYTLLVTKRTGVAREIVLTRSIIDTKGHFEVRVPKGDYEVIVSAMGWASSTPTAMSAGTTDGKIKLGAGGTLLGVVVDAATNAPLEYARVSREGAGGGASAQPAYSGTVTRADGSFELTGIPPGPFTISIGAGDYHPRLEGGLVATEGGTLGPIRLALRKLADGEKPKIELVGIGVKLAPDGEALRVTGVVPESGAAAAGIVADDMIVSIDGVPVTTLGMDGAVARIRGVAHTTLAVGLQRGGNLVTLVVERKPLRV
ncbi:MAG: sigma-70 family RNA polymerase sigma factor [Kofleriaceae bacterium]|nr:sigma-70 family RNA polymerase sigma factor [Kofleriaceae bacterium]